MKNIINHKINPPFIYFNGKYKEALKEKFNILKNSINNYDICYKNELEQITTFQNKLVEIIDIYFKGKSGKAYIEFEKLLSDTIRISKVNFFNKINKNHILYRARLEKIDQDIPFSNYDMFHIPFEYRNKVKSHRFSISGLPCLYLSDSVYTCWLELNRPPLDRFTVASFLVTHDVKVFDLSELYLLLNSNNYDKIIHFGEILSLFIACTFTQINNKDEFKPEYIIPQFLMQWLLDNPYNVKGIQYFTHKSPVNLDYKRLYTNFVFPTSVIAKDGHCSFLKETFKSIRTVSGNILQYVNNNPGLNIVNDIDDIKNSEHFYVLPECTRRYKESMFGLFEKSLSPHTSDLDDGTYAIEA